MISKATNKILFILQLPPPIHGASLMNSLVVNSEIIRRDFDVEVVNLQFAKSIKDISNFSITKVIKSFIFGIEIYKKLKLLPILAGNIILFERLMIN